MSIVHEACGLVPRIPSTSELRPDLMVCDDAASHSGEATMRWLAGLGVGITSMVGAAFVVGSMLIARREPELVPTAPSEPHTSFVETRSGRVNVLDLGDGEVILLVHGSGRSVADWQEGFAEALARNFRVIAFDNYGFGRSDRGHRWEYGISLWAREAIDLLDALHIARAVILGHSSGAAVAAIVSAAHPERIRAAVLVGHGLAVDPAQIVPALPGIGELWAVHDRWSPIGTRYV
jgi:pimeloyl-ACP methyl ester carboxylesterase